MSNATNPPIQDAEVVPNESATTPQTFDINAFNATLETVRRRLSILEKAKQELKKLNEMYNDFFANDELYNKADGIVKEALKKKKEIKSQLAKQPAAQETAGKIKDLKEQIKENEESLSDELMEYYRTAGVTEIEDGEGNIQEFSIVVKLKGKKRVEK